MAQYIDKSALLAEIEKLLNDEFQCSSYDEATGFQNALTKIKSFINTLEVKEVDLKKEISKLSIFPLRKGKDSITTTKIEWEE